MKVKELIEALQSCPQDTIVAAGIYDERPCTIHAIRNVTVVDTGWFPTVTLIQFAVD